MFTLNFSKVTKASLTAEDWRDEDKNDIAFPMVDINKVEMKEGYSPTEKENIYRCSLVHVEVVDALSKYKNKKAASELHVKMANKPSDCERQQQAMFLGRRCYLCVVG